MIRPIRDVQMTDVESQRITDAFLTIANAIQRTGAQGGVEVSMTGIVVEMKTADTTRVGPISFTEAEIYEVVSRINTTLEVRPPDESAEMAMMVVLMGHIRAETMERS